MKYQVLETPRLLLREFRTTDLYDFYDYAKNPRVGPNAGWSPHKDLSESQSILKNFIDEGNVWAILDKQSGRVIGSLGLHDETRRSNPGAKMIGYVLAEEFWGKGYMPEAVNAVIRYAFETLHLGLLTVYHYTFNEQSRRVIEKCAFQYEGTLRRAVQLFDGRITDLVCWSMTDEEYQNKARA